MRARVSTFPTLPTLPTCFPGFPPLRDGQLLQRQRGAARIRDDGERAFPPLGRRLKNHLPSERLSLVGLRRWIRDTHVRQPVRAHAADGVRQLKEPRAHTIALQQEVMNAWSRVGLRGFVPQKLLVELERLRAVLREILGPEEPPDHRFSGIDGIVFSQPPTTE